MDSCFLHVVRSHQSKDRVEARVVTTNYKMDDIPALKVEPYITTMGDYYAKIQFQLQSIEYPNSPLRNIDNTWAKVEKELIERVKAFFIANNETPESVSIKMDFNESGQNLESPTIQIHVKDSV